MLVFSMLSLAMFYVYYINSDTYAILSGCVGVFVVVIIYLRSIITVPIS